MPPEGLTLFIIEYGLEGHFVLGQEDSFGAIQGTTFDDFNVSPAGGAGLADAEVQRNFLAETIRTTEETLTQLERAIRQYQEATGKPLTEEEFLLPVGPAHPLMAVEGMNTAYFLDGHGNRIEFRPGVEGSFSLFAVDLERDQQRMAYENRMIEGIGQDIGQGLVVGLVFAVILGGALIIAIITVVWKVIASKARSARR